MLTILASYAQEEVETMSQNIKWTIRKKFERGQLNGCCSFLGYRWNDDLKKLVVVPEEAKIVRRVFAMYKSGCSLNQIRTALLKDGSSGVRGGKWEKTTISGILQNITYTGNLLLQKTYSQDPISKKARKNRGERTQYYAEGTHEAIVDMETFNAVRERLERMREVLNSECYEVRPFTKKLICEHCGRVYSRGRTKKSNGKCYYYWKCSQVKQYGSGACSGRMISENKLMAYSRDVLGSDDFDGDKFRETVEKVVVKEGGLEFYFYDGMKKEVKDVKRNHYTGNKENKG